MGYLTYVGIQACVGQVSLFFCNMRCQLSFSTVLEDMHSLIFVLHAIFSCWSSIVIHLERIALEKYKEGSIQATRFGLNKTQNQDRNETVN